MSKLISGAAAVAIAAAATQASATTIPFTVNSQVVQTPAPGINAWFFAGNGGLTFADGLADGIYDASVVTDFHQTTSFFLNVPNGAPPPPTFTFPAATWNFGLAELKNFSLTIDQGKAVAAEFQLGPKLPTTSMAGFDQSAFTFTFKSTDNDDPSAIFLISNGVNSLRLTGDLQGNPVPEPATWALMLVGFGMVGAAMRRRQRVSFSYA